MIIRTIAMKGIIIRKIRRDGTSPCVVAIPPTFGIREGQYVKLQKDHGRIIIEPLRKV